MMPLNLSWVLILSVLALGISLASPLPLGSESLSDELQSPTPSPEPSATSTPATTSDKPAPGGGEVSGHVQENPQQEKKQRDTGEYIPTTNTTVNTIITGKEEHDNRQNEQDQRDKKPTMANVPVDKEWRGSQIALADYTWWLVFATGCLALIAFAQVILFFKYLKVIQDSLTEAKKAADTGLKSAEAAEANAKAVMFAQRAYVQISHTDGLIHTADTAYELNFVISNIGQTPATIREMMFDSAVGPVGAELPDPPDYGPLAQRADTPPFLMAGDIVSSRHILHHTPDAITAIAAGTHMLIVYARIDYTDVFGVHHQVGYGRRYDPERAGADNLFIIPHHAYNYHREISNDNPKDDTATT